ncbi:MAG: peptidylprolyl isomerase [Proteobacteria bacterium]|nr:peptidylprolyl isomerase [Pseudomonadota bacterium]MBU1641418.1 peptidylprolyl isomerase [Pseudomonadota bacterium]
MQKKTILPLLCGLLFLSTSFALAEDGSKVLVTAGADSLTQAQFDQMLVGMPPQLKAMMDSQPELQQSMLNRWADFSILTQEAKAQGIDKEASIQNKLKDMTGRILVEEFIIRNTGKTEVADAAIQAYYDSHKAEYAHDEMVKAQHILIKVTDAGNDEQVAAAKAKITDIKNRLNKGEAFDVLAQKLSDDPGSKMNGGDLGFFGRGSMVPEFETAAFATKKGDVCEPFQTQFGWHVIKVTDSKGPGFTPLAEVRDDIKNKVQAESQQAEVESILANLKKKFPVTIH